MIVIAYAAAIVTILWYSMAENDKYMLKLLALMLRGATIMVLVDHVMSYIVEGGEFLEMTPEAVALGFVMVLGAIILWEAILILKDPRGVLRRKTVAES